MRDDVHQFVTNFIENNKNNRLYQTYSLNIIAQRSTIVHFFFDLLFLASTYDNPSNNSLGVTSLFS